MKKIAIVISIGFWMIACGSKDSSSSQKASVESSAKKEISGAKIFRQNCVLCHGEDGKLGLNGSKDLTLSKLTMEERVSIITNGKGAMMGFKGLLNDEKIKAVAEFTAQLVIE